MWRSWRWMWMWSGADCGEQRGAMWSGGAGEEGEGRSSVKNWLEVRRGGERCDWGCCGNDAVVMAMALRMRGRGTVGQARR